MPVSEQNCHPFQWGRYIWMHNGVVGGFSKIKRRLLAQLSDAAYNSVQSFHSDSAVSFALFLNHLPDLEHQQTPDVLVTAMQVCHSSDEWCKPECLSHNALSPVIDAHSADCFMYFLQHAILTSSDVFLMCACCRPLFPPSVQFKMNSAFKMCLF